MVGTIMQHKFCVFSQSWFPFLFSDYSFIHSFIHSMDVSVQFSSIGQSCLTLCDPMDCSTQASLSITISQSLLKLMSIKLVMPSNHLILIALFFCPQSFPASESFQVSWLFLSGGKSIGASALASVLVMTIQG